MTKDRLTKGSPQSKGGSKHSTPHGCFSEDFKMLPLPTSLPVFMTKKVSCHQPTTGTQRHKSGLHLNCIRASPFQVVFVVPPQDRPVSNQPFKNRYQPLSAVEPKHCALRQAETSIRSRHFSTQKRSRRKQCKDKYYQRPTALAFMTSSWSSYISAAAQRPCGSALTSGPRGNFSRPRFRCCHLADSKQCKELATEGDLCSGAVNQVLG